MIVSQIYTGNNYRNFNYLIACSETGEALAIDPLAYKMCYEEAKKNNWKITSIVNTHEHFDHIGGNSGLTKLTGAKIYAHENAKDKIPNVDFGLSFGSRIKIGNTVELEILDTPGHTMSHICLLSRGSMNALFSGDTLFNAGVGNCHNGGHPERLYETFYKILFELDQNTLIYPGHDYIKNNLLFTLDREPNNSKAKSLLDKVSLQDPRKAFVTDMSLEFKVNSFFRLNEDEVIKELEKKGELKNGKNPKEVFLALRRLRNNW